MEQWKNVAWSDEFCFSLHHVDGWLHVRCLPGKETLCAAIHVDFTLTIVTYLNIVADQLYPFVEMVISHGSCFFQQDNVPLHTAEMVQEWFEEHNNGIRC